MEKPIFDARPCQIGRKKEQKEYELPLFLPIPTPRDHYLAETLAHQEVDHEPTRGVLVFDGFDGSTLD